ncbi:MAG: PDZ domain-containing protein, partial [Anaerolineales bacterium]|nr:PDZ domain-containing protein [Anaerolineales bacterium]
MADSGQVAVGQLAVAIGNPFGLENTMTVGFISAIGRSLPVESSLGGPSYAIPDVIQTDAPINPGNSGGVLVNDRGEVVGVTTAIVSPVQASVGVGFAVPAAIVEQVIPALIEDGVYEYPWLGISGTSLTPELAEAMDLDADQRGALVGAVTEGGPADEAGLQPGSRTVDINGIEVMVGGDVIVAIEGQQVLEFDDVVAYLVRYTRPGDEIELTVLRDGRERHVTATLGVRPASEARSEVVEVPEELPEVAPVSQAWLGIMGFSMTPEIAEAMDLPDGQEGVLVQEVVSGGPADEGGLQAGEGSAQIEGQRILIGGDVIVAYDGDRVADMDELQARLSESKPGDEVTLTVLRDGREREVDVTLDSRPQSME